MIVGHSAVAFAIVAAGSALAGSPERRALRVGAAAAAFAAVPDVDMVYGLAVVAAVEGGTAVATIDAFWTATSRIHRLATHFLVTGAVAAVGVAAVAAGLAERWPPDRRETGSDGQRGVGVTDGGASHPHGEPAAGHALATDRWERGRRRAMGTVRLVAGLALLGGLVAWVHGRFAAVDALVVTVYVVAGVGVGVVAVRRLALGARAVLVAAAVGLLSHPFGDLLTGEPPALFYPLTSRFPAEALSLHPDPTLAFLAAFGVELATVWLAVGAFRLATGRPTRRHVDARALLGVPYALAAVVAPLPPPLVAYYPTSSLLAIGGLGVLVVRPAGLGRSVRLVVSGVRGRADRPGPLQDAVTTLAAVSLAAATYALCYLSLAA